MNKSIEHGEPSSQYKCRQCGGPLQTRYIITVEGEPKSICKNVSCVNQGDASMSKGVVVDVQPA